MTRGAVLDTEVTVMDTLRALYREQQGKSGSFGKLKLWYRSIERLA